MRKFKDVNELVNELKPDYPVYCIRPDSIKKSTKFFKENFPGKVLYAVKTNPNEKVLKQIISNGIEDFDVASLNEIKLIKKIKEDANLYFMHTVKSKESISSAYFDYEVKNFALDNKDELRKILSATNQAKDLNLFVRIAISNEHAEIDLSRKFGALPSEAIGLIRLCKEHSKKLGLSFHVGSQCMHKISYSKGISEIGNLIKKTKIIPDIINVGGGFPSVYPDLNPEPLKNYLDEIKKSFKNLKLSKLPAIICEPGRALVAESGSTIVKILLRKKNNLYINDGTYGSLFDAGVPNFILPTKMISNSKIRSKKLTSFSFFGPTCDSLDYMKGPFLLPNNIKEGDYIELGQLGAYGLTFRTKFNGFYSNEIFELSDKPIMSLYDDSSKFDYLVA
ncbi:MAG: type III PLP-dependent enzyme [Candidatus Pelagibacter sp. TMED272]|nr:ornithine decarboxylase [Pelagibacteraceae bacterium]RPG93490.1 MAG: type III PLP-dependent enzyme [Candidatus Pelagibacter sp. TMED272]|tara:strand:- start:15883 stop:17061 length:1179 start_codon:yes stop_codon:yes gene_type:complete